jgi:hypothetical protein
MSSETASSRRPSTEADMVRLLVESMQRIAGTASLLVEVRLHGRSRADIVAEMNGEVVAIEVKRTDWRRAVAQAVLNRYVVDRSYVAIWSSGVGPDVIDEARRRGIGVISLDDGGLEIVEGAPRAQPDAGLREALRQRLSERWDQALHRL